mgnify:CR=1 FL=1
MSKPLGKPDRIVVALGGNALGNNPVEQIEAVSNTAHALLGLIEQGNEIIITHGNGPQVGMIQNAFAAAHDAIGTPEMPLPECGAMSQGYIGYHLQQGIGREMHKRYKRWHAATVVTQIECDPDDPAFKNPTKPIGPFYTEEQAKEFMAEDPSKVFVEDSGRGWRRVVASPDPKKIVEADSILNLLDNEFIVIACGGGGIPVVRDYENKGCYKGVPAVIDKDLGGELLAEDCDADVLFLLTAVEHVAINFGKPNQEELEDLTADEAERLADEGQIALTGGIGLDLIKTQKQSLTTELGAGYRHSKERDFPYADLHELIGTLGLYYQYQFNDTVRFNQDLGYEFGDESQVLRSRSSISANLTETISAVMSYQLKDTLADSGNSRDSLLSVGMKYSY